MRVFLSSGEASGDAYAAAFVREFKKLTKDWAEYEGVGGKGAQEAGIKLVANSSTWGSIGFFEAAKVFRRAAYGMKLATAALSSGEPGLCVPIDFGFFNVRLTRRARDKGWRVLYFMPPGAWKKDAQGEDLPEITDEIVSPFPWSADLLNEMGGSAHWFGHPIKQLIKDSPGPKQARMANRVAIMPGSRAHEISLNLPVIAAALAQVKQTDLQAEFAVAPSVKPESLARAWKKLAPHRTNDLFTVGENYSVLQRARAAVICSGTATLEAALCRCPMVVIYRVNTGMRLQAAVAGFKPTFISLPNIILDRFAVPELVNRAATPAALATMLYDVLIEGKERRNQLAAFDEIDDLTGPADAITRTAQLALDLIRRPPDAVIHIGKERIKIRPV